MNISEKYFDNAVAVMDRQGKHTTNIFSTLAGPDALGTFYFVHGYGGSPIEEVLYNPAQIALDNGFNIVAIESIVMSATAPGTRNVADMRLDNHQLAIKNGLIHCAARPDLQHGNNISFSHSMGAHAILRLLIEYKFIREFFDRHWMVNPYLFPQKSLAESKKRLQNDPMWTANRPKVREIQGEKYTVPRTMQSFYIGLPNNSLWADIDLMNIERVVKRAVAPLRNRDFTLVLSQYDDMAESKVNNQVFETAPLKQKSKLIIPNADHWMDGASMGARRPVKNSDMDLLAMGRYKNAVRDHIWFLVDELNRTKK